MDIKSSEFDDIRPYYDSEVPSAMQRLAQNPLLEHIYAYLFPEEHNLEAFKQKIAGIKSSGEFQSEIMQPVMRAMIQLSISKLTTQGFENLDPNKACLFISNHRDIFMDSAMLQLLLYDFHHPTTQISFGDNLMSGQFVMDVSKSNKMFKVIRSANPKDFYSNSLTLSRYIRKTLTEDRESIWIAQRNGRTKNGIDATEQGVLKMFSMSAAQTDFASEFIALNIVPLSISYQYEPCDRQKTRELYLSRSQKYKKAPDEDLNSIIEGIMQFKGQVHYVISPCLTFESLQNIAAHYGKNERFKALAALIDTYINANYRLWNTNYMAADLLDGSPRYRDRYTLSELQNFKEYVAKRLDGLDGDPAVLREIFLSIYANPVANRT